MLPSPEQERRKQRRFDLHLKACLISEAEKTRQALPAFTRDISADGTFLFTTEFLIVGTRVAVYVVLPRRDGWQMLTEQTGVTFKGQVVRVEVDGIAVHFNRRWEICGSIPCPIGKTAWGTDISSSNI